MCALPQVIAGALSVDLKTQCACMYSFASVVSDSVTL